MWSRIFCLLVVQVVLHLSWTSAQDLGLCSNVSKLECRSSYQCPGGAHSCNYDSALRKYLCDSSCPNNPNRDPCTCLANYNGCHIQVNSSDAFGRPTFEGVPQMTYSCVNNTAVRNCNYDVHVLSYRRGNGDFSIGTSNTNVDITFDRVGNNRSLILVLLSHYPTYWMLNVPSGVTIARVLLSSYHVDVSDVMYPSGSVLNVEKVSNELLPSLAYGFDEYGDHVMQALQYLSERFGSVTSFTGTYEADRFSLSVQEQDTSDCISFVPQSAGPSPVVSAQCDSIVESGSCFGINYKATCSGDGYCRCPNLANRDECTCLVKFGSCSIEKSGRGEVSAGKPFYQRRPQITSSCLANDNCQYSVHTISTYEARRTGFSVRAGSAVVRISVSGDEGDTRPLILVLTSYYPVRWSLSIPQGVVFEKVIVSSYFRYISQTSVSYSAGRVLSFEKINCSRTVQCYADGYDDDTVEQLQYLKDRFGPVSSWSSAYRTDTWNLNIERRNGCNQNGLPSANNPANVCPVVPRSTVSSRPPFIWPVTDYDEPPMSTSAGGAVIGSVIVSVVILIVIIVSLVVVVAAVITYSRRKAAGIAAQPTTRRPPQQIYTQQGTVSYHSAEHLVDSRNYSSNVEAMARQPNNAGDLMDSAPPAYDEALNYPVPKKDPPPYTAT